MVGRYTVNDAVKSGDCLVTSDNFSGVFARLENFVAQLVGHIHHRIQKQKVLDYIKDLLSDVERKNVESISYFHGCDRQRLQSFIGQVEWDDEIILDKLVKKVANMIGEQNGILILDPTTFPKKGNDSVDVQRKWCGRLGKTENCQAATFLAYASSIEFALVDR